MQVIGCLGIRAYEANNCPVGIATQREDLRNRVMIDSADSLQNVFESMVHLMTVIARACGHERLSGFERRYLRPWKKDIADLTGVHYVGVTEPGK